MIYTVSLSACMSSLISAQDEKCIFCRPFSNAAASALVNTLAQTLTTVTISGINIVNVTEVSWWDAVDLMPKEARLATTTPILATHQCGFSVYPAFAEKRKNGIHHSLPIYKTFLHVTCWWPLPRLDHQRCCSQVQSRRKSRMLLGANDTVDAQLELEGSSPAAALSINSDLGNNVIGGNLQVLYYGPLKLTLVWSWGHLPVHVMLNRYFLEKELYISIHSKGLKLKSNNIHASLMQKTLARNGLVVQTLALIYSNSAVPQSNIACNSGSFSSTCIGETMGILMISGLLSK